MVGRTHVAAGILAASYLSGILDLDAADRFTCFVAAACGSLYPDIDHPGSHVSQYLGPISTIYNWAERRVMPAGMQHRGITHTPILLVILFLVGLFTEADVYILAAWLGTLSHLVLDTLTVSGIPVFWPLTARRFRVLSIKTGSAQENTVCATLWFLIFLRELAYYEYVVRHAL